MRKLIPALFSALLMLWAAGSALAVPDTLAVQNCAVTSITPSFVAVDDDSVFVPNNGATLVEFKNTNGASRTLTIHSQLPASEGYTVTNGSVTLDATSGDELIGPFKQSIWSDDNGYVLIVVSATTNVTAAVFKLSR